LERAAVATPLSPAKPDITSQGLRAGGFVFTAGIMPLDPDSRALPAGGIATQTHQAMRNLRALLRAAGSSLDRLVQITIYLKDWADFDQMNAVYVSYLNRPYPARACVEVCHIGDDAALEIVAIALAGVEEGGTG
jgi:2-iminobutanoate/2-iminopropanoate deaminase